MMDENGQMMENPTGYGMAGSQYLRGLNNYVNDEEENWDGNSVESDPDDFSQCVERPEHQFENGARYKG